MWGEKVMRHIVAVNLLITATPFSRMVLQSSGLMIYYHEQLIIKNRLKYYGFQKPASYSRQK